MRIGYALLPEVIQNQDLIDANQVYWMEKFVKALDMTRTEREHETFETRILMSWEILCIVCLPLMGYSGEPLQYEANFDTERPF
jgi:hypothetical protein